MLVGCLHSQAGLSANSDCQPEDCHQRQHGWALPVHAELACSKRDAAYVSVCFESADLHGGPYAFQLPHAPSVLGFQRLQDAACRPAPARCVRLTWHTYFIGFCIADSFFKVVSMMLLLQVFTCARCLLEGG